MNPPYPKNIRTGQPPLPPDCGCLLRAASYRKTTLDEKVFDTFVSVYSLGCRDMTTFKYHMTIQGGRDLLKPLEYRHVGKGVGKIIVI